MYVSRHGIEYMTVANVMYVAPAENGRGKAMAFCFIRSVCTEHAGFCHVVGKGYLLKTLNRNVVRFLQFMY